MLVYVSPACRRARMTGMPDDGNVSLSKFGGVHLAAFPAACGQRWATRACPAPAGGGTGDGAADDIGVSGDRRDRFERGSSCADVTDLLVSEFAGYDLTPCRDPLPRLLLAGDRPRGRRRDRHHPVRAARPAVPVCISRCLSNCRSMRPRPLSRSSSRDHCRAPQRASRGEDGDRIMTACVRSASVHGACMAADSQQRGVYAGQRRAWDSNPR